MEREPKETTTMKRTIIKITGFSLILLLVGIFIFSKVKRITPLTWGPREINQPMFSAQAINGYDPVTYFTEDKALKGNEENSFVWNDAEWHFQSEKNKILFSNNPEKYAPEYGGYCSFAVSKGFTANIDPSSFEIIEGKLYLFGNDDVKKDWINNLRENQKAANNNWHKI